MVLTFRRSDPNDGVQEAFKPDTDQETFFAKTMKTLSAKRPVDPKVAPIWERIGFKLGQVSVPVGLLSSNSEAHPGRCDKDWVGSGGRVIARGLKNTTLLKTTGTAQVVGSVEFRTFLPVVHLGSLTSSQQLVVPVLKSLTQAFRDYRDADVTHCDRGAGHITIGSAPSLGGAPVAQIIDTDRVSRGFDAPKMAHWFGEVAYVACQLGHANKSNTLPVAGTPAWAFICGSDFHDKSQLWSKQWLQKQLTTVEHAADSDGMCRGMRQLVNSVVKPAFQVAMGLNQAPEDWWAGEIDKWASRYYSSSLPAVQQGEGPSLNLDMVFKEAKHKDLTSRALLESMPSRPPE